MFKNCTYKKINVLQKVEIKLINLKLQLKRSFTSREATFYHLPFHGWYRPLHSWFSNAANWTIQISADPALVPDASPWKGGTALPQLRWQVHGRREEETSQVSPVTHA